MEVKYIDHMGTDLSVVNAAKVSFAKRSEWVEWDNNDEYFDGAQCQCIDDEFFFLSEKDVNLIRFLARGMAAKDFDELVDSLINVSDRDLIKAALWAFRRTPTHEAPFGHCSVSLHVRAPIFVARQLVKHEYLRMSEVSRRYVSEDPDFFTPQVWRKRAANVKQGSSSEEVELVPLHDDPGCAIYLKRDVPQYAEDNLALYKSMIDGGVCPELARLPLPLSTYTEWQWSGSLDAFANMYNLRKDSHAQEETRHVAELCAKIIQPLFPVSWRALTKVH